MPASIVARALALAAAAACLAATAQSTLYRWVDKDGKVQYTDQPPPADAKNVTQKRYGQAGDELPTSYSTLAATKKNPVMLYVVPNCEPCAKGREMLSNRGVPFSERDAQSNIETQTALKQLTGDLNVPVLIVGESRIKGFEEGAWNAALDSAGYPRERAYGQAPTTPVNANIPSAPKEPPKDAAEAAPPK